MKRAGQFMLSALCGLLLLLACQALVERPERELPAPRPIPVRAALFLPSAETPGEAAAPQLREPAAERRQAPAQADASVPANAPVRDGNGIPLAGRSYVRTVYTACRLEETSG